MRPLRQAPKASRQATYRPRRISDTSAAARHGQARVPLPDVNEMNIAASGQNEDHDGLPPNERAIAMLAVGIAVSISVLVGSIANIALPTIARDMHVTPAESIWVVNAYQLAVTVCLMPCASLGDVHGHRRVYIWASCFTPPARSSARWRRQWTC